MPRHVADFYPTPKFFSLCLKDWLEKEGFYINTALEPFWGNGAITEVFPEIKWTTNDLFLHTGQTPDYVLDLSKVENIYKLPKRNALITNMPYNLASDNEVMEALIGHSRIL